MSDIAPSMGEITHISNDGEWTYPDTNAAYVLSHENTDWCQAVIRTEDGEPLGSDGWQQMLCPEDATFTRDLRWIVPELNRVAAERDALSAALYVAVTSPEDDPEALGVTLDHETGQAHTGSPDREDR